MAVRRSIHGLLAVALAMALVLSSVALTTAAGATGVSPAAGPANDNFGQATAISSLPFHRVQNVTSATVQINEPLLCGLSGNTVWYTYTADFTGKIGLDTRGSNFSTVIVAYTGSTLATLSEWDCGYLDTGNNADVIVDVTSGTTYSIQVGVYSGNTDGRSLHFNAVKLTTPANDNSMNARVVHALPYLGSVQDIRGATFSAEPTSPCLYQSHTVWYWYQADKTQTVIVDSLGDFPAAIAIYRGAGMTIDSCTDAGTVAFHAVKGTTYRIQVGAGDYRFGSVQLRLRAATSPANDRFANATPINHVPADLTGSTLKATLQPGEPHGCGTWVGSTLWYSFKAPATTNYRFDTASSNFYESSTLFSGSSLGSLTAIGCGNTVVARLTKNHTYHIAVGGTYGENGQFTIHVSRGPAPANDNISHAQNIGLASPFTAAVSTTYATNEPGEAVGSCGSLPAGTVWYSFTAASKGSVRVQTLGSSFDTMVAVWTGIPGSLTQVGCDDDSHLPSPDGLQSSLAFRVHAGVKYWVQVGGYSSYSGDLKVQIQRVTPPANDQFANATVIANGFTATNLQTRNATVQAGEPSHCSSGIPANGGTVWYAYHATSTNQLTFTANDSANDRIVDVLSGTDFSTLTEVGCQFGSVSWTPVADTDYRIQVAGYGGDISPMNLSFTVAP